VNGGGEQAHQTPPIGPTTTHNNPARFRHQDAAVEQMRIPPAILMSRA
jgi:hypothetical protein